MSCQFGAYGCSAQAFRTHPRSQRCARSACSRGCQSNETVTSGVETGRGKPCIPARRFPVCRSGTLAIRSEARARASAVEKPPTIVAICRSSPSGSRASSIGPLSRPRRGDSDRRCARHRGWKPCSRNTPFARWRRVMTQARHRSPNANRKLSTRSHACRHGLGRTTLVKRNRL